MSSSALLVCDFWVSEPHCVVELLFLFYGTQEGERLDSLSFTLATIDV